MKSESLSLSLSEPHRIHIPILNPTYVIRRDPFGYTLIIVGIVHVIANYATIRGSAYFLKISMPHPKLLSVYKLEVKVPTTMKNHTNHSYAVYFCMMG